MLHKIFMNGPTGTETHHTFNAHPASRINAKKPHPKIKQNPFGKHCFNAWFTEWSKRPHKICL